MVRERRVVGRGATTASVGVNPDQARSDLLKQLSAQQLRYTEKSPWIVQLEAQIADLEKASAAQSNIDELKALTASYQAEYAAKAGATEKEGPSASLPWLQLGRRAGATRGWILRAEITAW